MRTFIVLPVALAFVIAALVTSPSVAAQYFCGGKDETAEAGLRAADVVFLGRAEEILPDDPTSGDERVYLRMLEHQVRFTVVESFKGVTGDSLVVGWGYEGFIIPFRVGETYLVYAYTLKQYEQLGVDTCTRTRPLALAGPDLEYLRRPSTAPLETRLTGSVARRDLSPKLDFRPHAGITVTVTGPGLRRETRTDASGTYRFVGIPPGNYEVRFSVPAGPGSAPIAERVTVREGAWGGPDCIADEYSKVVGFLVGPDGRPLPGADVSAVALDDARAGDFDSSDEVVTAVDGRFELRDLDPGRYVIVANASDLTTSHSPFRRTLFPGTRTLGGARVVSVEEGRETRLPDFKIDKVHALTAVRGFVVDGEGRPVTRARVMIHQEDREVVDASGVTHSYGWSDDAPLDDDGRFVVVLVSGATYEISVRTSDAGPEAARVTVRPVGTLFTVRIVVPAVAEGQSP